MIDRRILLASVASLLGLGAFRWLRSTPAQAAEKFEIEKSDAEWRAQLTPQQYEILRKHGKASVGVAARLGAQGLFLRAGRWPVRWHLPVEGPAQRQGLVLAGLV